MKRYITLLSVLSILFIFQSCKKYEEGPFFSFKSAEKRIVGNYHVDKYMINGTEISLEEQGISEYRIVYNIDGTGKSYITINEYLRETDFEWELDKKKEKIREKEKGQGDEWGAWSDYKTILKLTNDEFWIKDANETEAQEFHLIENKM